MILDIRTKVILLLYANYILLKRLFGIHEFIFIGMMLALFVLAKQVKKGLIYSTLFVCLYLLDVYFFEYLSKHTISLISILTLGGRLMFHAFVAGSYLITTTPMHNFIVGLRKWKITESILMTFAVMMRFFPTIKKDYYHINQALKLQGKFISFKDILIHPIQYYEKIIIPLLMSASRSANDLIIATLTKGITIQTKTTSYKDENLNYLDYFIIVLIIGIILMTEGGILK